MAATAFGLAGSVISVYQIGSELVGYVKELKRTIEQRSENDESIRNFASQRAARLEELRALFDDDRNNVGSDELRRGIGDLMTNTEQIIDMCRSLQNLSRREAWKQRDKIKAKVQELQAESFEYRFNAILNSVLRQELAEASRQTWEHQDRLTLQSIEAQVFKITEHVVKEVPSHPTRRSETVTPTYNDEVENMDQRLNHHRTLYLRRIALLDEISPPLPSPQSSEACELATSQRASHLGLTSPEMYASLYESTPEPPPSLSLFDEASDGRQMAVGAGLVRIANNALALAPAAETVLREAELDGLPSGLRSEPQSSSSGTYYETELRNPQTVGDHTGVLQTVRPSSASSSSSRKTLKPCADLMRAYARPFFWDVTFLPDPEVMPFFYRHAPDRSSSYFKELRTRALCQPATDPVQQCVFIHLEDLPWSIVVDASEPSLEVSFSDVLAEVHNALQRRMSKIELGSLRMSTKERKQIRSRLLERPYGTLIRADCERSEQPPSKARETNGVGSQDPHGPMCRFSIESEVSRNIVGPQTR